MRPSSVVNGGARHADFARLATIGTVILPIHAEADIVLSLANAAVAIALAVFFRLVANGTANLRGGHSSTPHAV